MSRNLDEVLDDQDVYILVAMLVHKAGGDVTIDHEDAMALMHSWLETYVENGTIHIRIERKE